MDTGETLEAGLLKIGHHGSDTGTSLPFLQAVAPEAAVISVGEGNSYDMPHDSVLDRLGQMGVALYRTDLQGDHCGTDTGGNLGNPRGDPGSGFR